MRLVIATLLVAASSCALAQTYVNPHVRKDGTFVQGHIRSAPNDTRIDNYGTKGNINPYTGQSGTQNPWPSPNNPNPRY